jgi:glucose-6-phosphate isomerase
VKKTENRFTISLAGFQKGIAEAETQLQTHKILERIWKKEYRVWSENPDEIANRLGWLDSPAASATRADEIVDFVSAVMEDGYTSALLLGMGGSSLAAEVFGHAFAVKAGYLNLEILDSTHPEAVLERAGRFDPEKTLYIVATKSGGTVETFSFMKFFYNQALARLGKEKTGRHFIAITDPGCGLETAARQLNFRKIFLNDPNIGGRYSALSLFGMVPAALIGADIKKLLKRAARMAARCKPTIGPLPGDNAAARLGVIMGQLADSGRDKITFITSAPLVCFADWLEQLIAESTGKAGKGILPLVGEEIMPPAGYAADRFFVYLRLQDDHTHDHAVRDLITAGHPVVEIVCRDVYDLGGEYFRWEMATAVAGWRMGIQPFDQPNVEAAKILARDMLAEYAMKGKLPQPSVKFAVAGMKIYAETNAGDFNSLWREYAGDDGEGFRNRGNEYVAIQAYIRPDKNAWQALQKIRTAMQRKYKTAVTVGYGPRFLHSTGQLHKGDAGKGLFIQIVSRMDKDAPIPDMAGADPSRMSFGTLITAQAFGDRQALLAGGRRVITFLLDTDQETGYAALSELLANDRFVPGIMD